MYTVVFIEPESSGNIGALARVMKNFGLRNLILVNPQCKIDRETRVRAKHAFDVIENARIVKDFSKIGDFDFVIGTTGKIVTNYDEIRHSITPRELAKQIKDRARVALVLGREGIGLKNDELAKCDIVVHIATDHRYPVMNVSHAAAIVFYELFSADKKLGSGANLREKKILFDHFEKILNRLEGIRDKKKVAKVFRNVMNRAMIEGKEAHTLAGALNEIKKKV
jgi:TrmH family RNA methyltransferase